MAAVLEGLLLRPWDGVREPVAAVGAELIRLGETGIVLIPLTGEVGDRITGGHAEEPVLGFYRLHPALAEWSRHLSLSGASRSAQRACGRSPAVPAR